MNSTLKAILHAYLVLGFVMLSAGLALATDYKTLFKFSGIDGQTPDGAVIVDAAGNLFGTARSGGSHGGGVVFKLAPNPDGSWTESAIHEFAGPDGASLAAGLTFDSAGNLYGTTQQGGVYDLGTVFKIIHNSDGSWTHSVLFSFSGSDGGNVLAGVIFDAAGRLYGTTFAGGRFGRGTVYQLTAQPDGSWAERVLYSFRGMDGGGSDAGVVFDTQGNLFGTTKYGGTHEMGTVYRLTPQTDGTWRKTKLHNFKGVDGAYPVGGLILDAAGNLYGTTTSGGASGMGTVYKLWPQPEGGWKYTKLHSFNGGDGAYPWIDLIADARGSLYGTTVAGGAYGSGTVFKLISQPDGHWGLEQLHVFTNYDAPYTALMLDAAGNLYGETQFGGNGYGVVFQIAP